MAAGGGAPILVAADREVPHGIGDWRKGARGRGGWWRGARGRGGWVRGSVSVDFPSISLLHKDALSSYMSGTD